MASSEVDFPALHIIGRGACGTVWAASEKGPAFKREDGGPGRSLKSDFDMHQRVLQSFQELLHLRGNAEAEKYLPHAAQAPACHGFISAENQSWWAMNLRRFPSDHTPCNIIQSQRIPPFPESIRRFLIDKYCPAGRAGQILTSNADKDCLIRPYLGRRRTQSLCSQSRFKAFSLRNFPLHVDQMEEIGIPTSDLHQYARVMAETLAIFHWVGQIDGNDIEFVLAPSQANDSGTHNVVTVCNVLGSHDIWVLDFDLCKDMEMNDQGVVQAAIAFWRNDPYYPRPGKDTHLWDTFRERYIQMSEDCTALYEPREASKRRSLSKSFIEFVEKKPEGRSGYTEVGRSSVFISSA